MLEWSNIYEKLIALYKFKNNESSNEKVKTFLSWSDFFKKIMTDVKSFIWFHKYFLIIYFYLYITKLITSNTKIMQSNPEEGFSK